MKHFLGLIASVLWLTFPTAGQAGKFSNQFVEFELPPKWDCTLEGAEWICQSTEEEKKRDAIIILAAKLKGPQDSLDQYLDYLKEEKTYEAINQKRITSDPKYSKTIKLQDHPWVDSLHLHSELPDFYTRYLATVKNDIGVLVTYSIKESEYQNYLNDFEKLVKSLRVFRKPGGLNAKPAKSHLIGDTNIPDDVAQGSVFGDVPTGEEAVAIDQKEDSGGFLLLLLLGGAGVAFIIVKKKKAA